MDYRAAEAIEISTLHKWSEFSGGNIFTFSPGFRLTGIGPEPTEPRGTASGGHPLAVPRGSATLFSDKT